MEEVILVDERDNVLGTMEKLEAHKKSLLHRAFSIFIFNDSNEMLIHQRADSKYHSGGLWTNACCSHPRDGEETLDAAKRRLEEELGFTTNLDKAFEFIYEAQLDNGVSEHEFDHVFIGRYSGEIRPDPTEVKALRWIDLSDLRNEMDEFPERFTVWFKIAFPKISDYLENQAKFTQT